MSENIPLTKNDRVQIGRFTYYSQDLQLRTWASEERIQIGSFCSIADKVIICAGGQHRRDIVSTFPFDVFLLKKSDQNRSYQSTKATIIGNDVWIGTGVMILGGVQIGDGAIIGAGSVVSSNVPAYAVVAGNPAQVLRYRFSSSSVQRLLKISWWNWSEEKVRNNLDWFYQPISKFIEHFDSSENSDA